MLASVQQARRPAAECSQMAFVQDDISKTADLVCVRNCTCPADGGACHLDKVCVGCRCTAALQHAPAAPPWPCTGALAIVLVSGRLVASPPMPHPQDCTLKIDIQGGGGGSRRHGGALFFWFCFALLLGGVAAMGYVHWYGVPTWLPIRERGELLMRVERHAHHRSTGAG